MEALCADNGGCVTAGRGWSAGDWTMGLFFVALFAFFVFFLPVRFAAPVAPRAGAAPSVSASGEPAGPAAASTGRPSSSGARYGCRSSAMVRLHGNSKVASGNLPPD